MGKNKGTPYLPTPPLQKPALYQLAKIAVLHDLQWVEVLPYIGRIPHTDSSYAYTDISNSYLITNHKHRSLMFNNLVDNTGKEEDHLSITDRWSVYVFPSTSFLLTRLRPYHTDLQQHVLWLEANRYDVPTPCSQSYHQRM